MWAGVELGGTKIVCGYGNDPEKPSNITQFVTGLPDTNVRQIKQFLFADPTIKTQFEALGVAAFGPLELDPTSRNYGQVLNTPKVAWADFALLTELQQSLGLPTAITTDVNAALLAEHHYGAAQDTEHAAYITIGTGVGAGLLSQGRLVQGFTHPEIGHMRVPNHGLTGHCAFHGDCVEGLVSGPAIAKHTGQAAELLTDDHTIWQSVSKVIADLCVNLLLSFAPQKIIIGGGVMSRPNLLDLVRHHAEDRTGGYLTLKTPIEDLIVTPALGGNSGITGALLIAQSTKQEYSK